VIADSANPDIILFDGVCVLCSHWYRFVSARDHGHRFRFVAVQSAEGRALAEKFGIDPDNPDTFILVAAGKASVRSDAALRILAELPRWRWTVVLRAIPAALRDALYNVIARNRYRWFGRLDVCVLPGVAPEPEKSSDLSHQPCRRPPA
jgi:predicted DCC family thiol-disulfide oxidoreductase YuxK